MGRLTVEAEQTARATPEEVWALVSDATGYPEWGPWSDACYQRPGDDSPHGPGAVYWLRSARRAYLRYVTMVEKVLEVEEGQRLTYTVISGIPVRDYRAEVTLTPAGDGTHIRWAAAWGHDPGRADCAAGPAEPLPSDCRGPGHRRRAARRELTPGV